MSPTIDELLPLSKTLNAESNELNKTIATINEKLAQLNLGIEVWLDSKTAEAIGFCKVETGGKGGWQLAYRQSNGFYPEALLSASRDTRIEGLRLVPEILDELQQEAEERIRTMQEAKKLAAEL